MEDDANAVDDDTNQSGHGTCKSNVIGDRKDGGDDTDESDVQPLLNCHWLVFPVSQSSHLREAPLTLNIPTMHIWVEIYNVIITSNCGELLGLEHWCFILM